MSFNKKIDTRYKRGEIYRYIKRRYFKIKIGTKRKTKSINNIRIPRINLVKESIIYVLRKELVKKALVVGHGEKQTAVGFYSKLLGFYGGISKIDIGYLIYHLRRNLKLMIVALLKNYRFCFVIHECTEIYKKNTLFFDYHFVSKSWTPGAVSNFIKKNTARKAFKRIPQFVVTLGRIQPAKVHDINKEMNRAGLQIVNFLDSNNDLVLFQHYVPINTKHFFSTTYYFFLLSVLIKRSILLKKLSLLKKLKKKKNVLTKKK